MMKTIAFDFDGVIHSYRSGWQGAEVIPDMPVYGIADVIRNLSKDYRIIVYTTRALTLAGKEAVKRYLSNMLLESYIDDVTAEKPPAVCYVDDRAITFDGNVHGLEERIRSFKSWTEKEEGNG